MQLLCISSFSLSMGIETYPSAYLKDWNKHLDKLLLGVDRQTANNSKSFRGEGSEPTVRKPTSPWISCYSLTVTSLPLSTHHASRYPLTLDDNSVSDVRSRVAVILGLPKIISKIWVGMRHWYKWNVTFAPCSVTHWLVTTDCQQLPKTFTTYRIGCKENAEVKHFS